MTTEKVDITLDKSPSGEVLVKTRQELPEEGLVRNASNHTRALVRDVTDWAELRLKKLQLDLEAKIEREANKVIAAAVLGAMAALGGLFALIAASIALGDLLGHVAWGFIIVGAVLGLIGFIFYKVKPDLVKLGDGQVEVPDKRLAPDAPRGRLLAEPQTAEATS